MRILSLQWGIAIVWSVLCIGVLPVFAEDADSDGLSDADEARYGTQIAQPDTDLDGYPDGLEVTSGYDPLTGNAARLKKRIVVKLSKQKLSYFSGKAKLGEMIVSTGKWNLPTPTGTFAIQNKSPRAWSKLAGLWMPYWMGFKAGKYGIHELPEWPGGKKEGADHLGKPVSHGCIRLGPKNAKKLYNWTEIGTELTIVK